MEPLTCIEGRVAPLNRANVDTDAIIPKQYLKSVSRSGFGPNLFDDWRYLDPGEPDQDHSTRRLNPDFVLNQPRYRGAEILLTRTNFGCGSSREHAVWALLDAGFRVVIAPSFADIFYGNCTKTGLLPVVLPAETVRDLMGAERAVVDLERQVVEWEDGSASFDINRDTRRRLLEGLDEIALTLANQADIDSFEDRGAQAGSLTTSV
jgi:3-isopropylmalate/(R)-2-methylmalate dehydratase small subunit